MATELDVLGIVSERLSAQGLAYMLTGSFALAYCATPRMTRDLDLVVEITERDVDPLVGAFDADFYVDADAARAAVRSGTFFNLMHLESGIKVDLIVRKSSEYRELEFERRRVVSFAGIRTSIVSVEDLVLSKLAWARDSGSDVQRPGSNARVAPDMNDTSQTVAALVAAHHRTMSATDRMRAAAASFEVARSIVESSLDGGLTREARPLAVARRFYAGELPEAALLAHARFGGTEPR